MQPKVANMKFHLTGLLKDAELSKNLISDFRVLEIIKILIADKIVNQFVNEAWKQIYQDLVAAAKPSWGPIALALVNEDFSFIKIISWVQVKNLNEANNSNIQFVLWLRINCCNNRCCKSD